MRKMIACLAVLSMATVASATDAFGFDAGSTSPGFSARDLGPISAVPADFMWDDGTAEGSIGVNNGATGTTFGWANQFTNNTGGAITIANMEIAFNRVTGPIGVGAVGDAVDAVAWVDAGATSNLVNATLVDQFAIPGGVHSVDGMTFATVNFSGGGFNVPAGAQFYVGGGDIQTSLDSLIRFPAAQDQTVPHTNGVSWAFFGPAVFDPVDIASQTSGPIESFGPTLAGNWLIRANVPEPATLSLLALGGLALARRRR